MYFAGLRVGEMLGLRLSDLHFAERSGALGCSYPGAHLHVVPRANVDGARVKNKRPRVVPVAGPLVGAFDHYLRRERDACAAAAGCDLRSSLAAPSRRAAGAVEARGRWVCAGRRSVAVKAVRFLAAGGRRSAPIDDTPEQE